MKALIAILALALAAGPAAAQIHERGVARDGAVIATKPGGTAFMCRVACSLNGQCEGWSWTRPGASGPNAMCRMVSGSVTARPDPCCDSGLSDGGGAVASGPRPQGDQYASRTTPVDGAPVELAPEPSGEGEESGGWAYGDTDGEDSAPSEGPNPERFAAALEPPQGAQDGGQMQQQQPAAQQPTARLTRTGPPIRAGGPPRYSVQREYEQPAATGQQQNRPPS